MNQNNYEEKKNDTLDTCGQNDEFSPKYYSPGENHINNDEDYEGRLGTSGTTATAELGTPLFYTLPNDVDIFREAIKGFHKLHDLYVKKSTLLLLLAFQKQILNQISQIDFSGYLPPLQLRSDEDGSVLLEWIFKDFRIGFVIEPEGIESSWYLVSNSKLDEASSSGLLNVKECEALLHNLISFVISNV